MCNAEPIISESALRNLVCGLRAALAEPPCSHERLNEEGFCRKCSADCRGGVPNIVAEPQAKQNEAAYKYVRQHGWVSDEGRSSPQSIDERVRLMVGFLRSQVTPATDIEGWARGIAVDVVDKWEAGCRVSTI